MFQVATDCNVLIEFCNQLMHFWSNLIVNAVDWYILTWIWSFCSFCSSTVWKSWTDLPLASRLQVCRYLFPMFNSHRLTLNWFEFWILNYAHLCIRPRTLAGSRALALPTATLQSGVRERTTVWRYRLTTKRLYIIKAVSEFQADAYLPIPCWSRAVRGRLGRGRKDIMMARLR